MKKFMNNIYLFSFIIYLLIVFIYLFFIHKFFEYSKLVNIYSVSVLYIIIIMATIKLFERR